MFKVPEQYRVRKGAGATSLEECGLNGMFLIPNIVPGQKLRTPLKVIATDGRAPEESHHPQAWEHVSVSLPARCPTWGEMCKVKSLFWDDEDCVMQLHPPRSQWVSNHAYCLHLWRPVDLQIPQPPAIMVGIAEIGDITPTRGRA